MFNKLIQFSLKYPVLIIGFYILLCVLGGIQIVKMNVDVFPDLNKPSATVLIETKGLAPQEAEKSVLIPIENAISGGAGITRLSSAAAVGYAMVTAEFDWNTDVLQARQIITERLAQVSGTLPDGIEMGLTPISSIMGEVMLVGVYATGDKVSLMDVHQFVQKNMRKRFLSVPGVSNVSVIGGDIKQYQITLDTTQMQLLGITMDEVMASVSALGINGTGGFINTPYTEAMVRILARPENIEDIKKTVIIKEGRKDMPAITLGQIALIQIAPQKNQRGVAGVNGQMGVLISIAKQPRTDTLKLTQKLEAELIEIEKNIPADIHFEKDIFKQSRFIQNAIDNITGSLWIGSFLIAIILFVFLLNVKGTAIVLTVIPCTFVMTALVFNWFGLSINTMTLGGVAMALGSLIDDAIVGVANVYKRLKENKHNPHPEPIKEVVLNATSEVRNSIVFSTVLIFLVFLPLFALTGIEGRIFMPLALAFILSMTLSLIVSVTLTPVLSFYLLPTVKSLGRKHDSVMVHFIKRIHCKLLRFCFANTRRVLIGLGVVLGISFLMFFGFGKEFMPPFNEGSFNITIASPPGTNVVESNRIGQIAERELLKIPEVAATGRKQGRVDMDAHPLGVNIHEIEVRLKDDLTRSKEQIMEDIRHRLNIPGVVLNIGQPISHRIDLLISGVRSGLAVKVFGLNQTQMDDVASQIENVMKDNANLTDVGRDMQVQIPQILVRFNRDKAVRHGVSLNNAVQMSQMAMSGIVVSEIMEDEYVYDVVLQLKQTGSFDINQLKKIPIATVNGHWVTLGSVADILYTKGQNEIARENNARRIVISANFQNADAFHVVTELQKQIQQTIQLPEGIFIQYDGQFQTQSNASRNILWLSMLSFSLMFMALYINFKSLNLATQLMISLPFSLIGGVIGIALSGGIVSIATIIGLVALTGIAIRNGILLIELYLKQMNAVGRVTPADLIALTQERIEPVMMTTLTSIIGFLPLIIGGNTTGKEILYPVAVVISCGLLTTTVLNLLITPIVFYVFYKPEKNK